MNTQQLIQSKAEATIILNQAWLAVRSEFGTGFNPICMSLLHAQSHIQAEIKEILAA